MRTTKTSPRRKWTRFSKTSGTTSRPRAITQCDAEGRGSRLEVGKSPGLFFPTSNLQPPRYKLYNPSMSIRASANRISARKRAFDAAVKGVLWYVGWLGMGLLIACAVLWMVPGAVPADRLPIYTMIAMLMASFVGWLY